MKILHLSRSDIDGGAARGTYWLHKALQQAGVESNILVEYKRSDDPTILAPQGIWQQGANKLRATLDSLPLSFYPDRNPALFSVGWIPTSVHRRIKNINPDLVNIHAIGYGFITPEDLSKFNQPIVWTLRDMSAFTGGCHYSADCDRYENICGLCPHLKSEKENDISRKILQRKLKHWENLDLTIVTISQWLADCARSSNLFKNSRIKVIHNALDESRFKPMPKTVVREILGWSKEKKIILFGAINPTKDARKGFGYLVPALQKLAASNCKEKMEVVVFGSSKPQTAPDLGLKTTYMGKLTDDITMAIVCAAADVTIVPSIQEAFGKTAIESLACGTPVVSFNSTGLKDIVEHQKNGYRAQCFSPDDLANGIAWVLQDEERWQALSRRSRSKVEEEFTLKTQVQAYVKLYQEILGK